MCVQVIGLRLILMEVRMFQRRLMWMEVGMWHWLMWMEVRMCHRLMWMEVRMRQRLIFMEIGMCHWL